MALYRFDALTDGARIDFDVWHDQLLFSGASAARTTVQSGPDGLLFTAGGKTVAFDGLRIGDLGAGTLRFTDGSHTVVASQDNHYTTHLQGTAAADQLIGDVADSPITRVTTAFDGSGLANGGSTPAVSADGRWVAFASSDDRLPAGAGAGDQIYVKDMATGVVSLVSSTANGVPSLLNAQFPLMSADGRTVAYTEAVVTQPGPDPEFGLRIVQKDLASGAQESIDTTADGQAANGNSAVTSVSADGRWVVFHSAATNLETFPGGGRDLNASYDVFVKDMTTGVVGLVSSSSDGTRSGQYRYSTNGQISADGRHVVFDSTATNFVGGDSNGRTDVFLKDLDTGVTTRVSTASDGSQARSGGSHADISGDGGTVVFQSLSGRDLVGEPVSADAAQQIYVKFVASGETRLVSSSADGTRGNGDADLASISADGRYVAFRSAASNLVAGDTNGLSDVFVKDLATGRIARVSVSASGAQSDGPVFGVEISDDGRHIVFHTVASTLVAGDDNGRNDVYLAANPLHDTTLAGGAGNDVYRVHRSDQAIAERGHEGIDTVRSDVSFHLPAQVENLLLEGRDALAGTGNAGNNLIRGNAGNNRLDGGAGVDTVSYANATKGVKVALDVAELQSTGFGVDTLSGFENLIGSHYGDVLRGNAKANVIDGGTGRDVLTGGAGRDVFVFRSASGDHVTDFRSGTDLIRLQGSSVRPGHGDAYLDSGVVIHGPGGFGADAELVILTTDLSGSIGRAQAAAAIGSAQSAYAEGDRAVFAVDNGRSTTLLLFTSQGADAHVSAAELQVLAVLDHTAATTLGDYVFGP